MSLTDYHAKYFAHELTKRCSSDSLEKLAGQKQIKVLESQRNETGLQQLFTIRWKLA